jgi:hypothetical protein
MIVIYDRSFIVLALRSYSHYDRTLITIVNYDPKTFIVQATDFYGDVGYAVYFLVMGLFINS